MKKAFAKTGHAFLWLTKRLLITVVLTLFCLVSAKWHWQVLAGVVFVAVLVLLEPPPIFRRVKRS